MVIYLVNGEFTTTEPKGGFYLRIVVPEKDKISGTVQVKNFYSGRGGNNSKACLDPKNYFLNDGQYININRSSRDGQSVKVDYVKLLAYLKSKGYNISGFNNNTVSGVSLGGQKAISAFKTRLADNPSKPLNLNLYDPTVTRVGELPGSFNATQKAQMRKNGSNVRLITLASRQEKWKDSKGLKGLVKAGVNVLMISGNDKKNKAGARPNGHEQCYKMAVKTGWEDFFDGTIEITDIKNEVNVEIKKGKKKSKKVTYNLDYKVHIPYVDGDKVKWRTYKLSELQDVYKNYFALSEEDKKELINALRYIERGRVRVDYDYMSAVRDIESAARNLRNNSKAAVFSYSSNSVLLSEENNIIKSSYNVSSSVVAEVPKTSGMIEEAIESYKQTEVDNTKSLDEIIE